MANQRGTYVFSEQDFRGARVPLLRKARSSQKQKNSCLKYVRGVNREKPFLAVQKSTPEIRKAEYANANTPQYTKNPQ